MKHGPAPRDWSFRSATRSVFSCQKKSPYERNVPTRMIVCHSDAHSSVCLACEIIKIKGSTINAQKTGFIVCILKCPDEVAVQVN